MENKSALFLFNCISRFTRQKQLTKQSRRRRQKVRLRNRMIRFRHHQQQQKMLVVTFLVTVLGPLIRKPRRLWSFPRSSGLWPDSLDWWHDEQWTSHLRMRKCTFMTLCETLRPYIQKSHTNMRNALPCEKIVAATLWKLATNVEFRTVSLLFGVSKAAIVIAFHKVCNTIVKKILHKYIILPNSDRLRTIIQGFHVASGLPQVGGAIDGTLIEILAPTENACDYYCRKNRYAMHMQAVVDHEGLFMNCYVVWTGKVHDARIFSQSSIYIKGCAGTLFPNWLKDIEGVSIPVYLLGDPAYPLLPWLMKPFPDVNLTEVEMNFNYRHSSARMTVERTFGRLKGRWRCLLKRLDHDVNRRPTIILACCVLHNMCELNNEHFDDNLYVYPSIRKIDPPNSVYDHAEAREVRRALSIYLYNRDA